MNRLNPIIKTKLHRAAVGSDTVCRERLHAILRRGLAEPISLISAPAGYGKSVLVGEWCDSLDIPTAWLSLDTSDGDLVGFGSYLLAAIRTVFPEAGAEIEDLLESPNPLSVKALGGYLVNEIDALEESFVLVLDDYHRIETNSPVHDLLCFILEHPPPNLHLVVVTRSDPPLPLASLRGRAGFAELRLTDLRFSTEEIAGFLDRTASVSVSDAALANLARQTEGWVVGLRLVALHLRHVDDAESFLRSFAGGIWQTQEYLLGEVLENQPAGVKDCLLRASILDRFCPELLDAIGLPGSLSGHELVSVLQQQNLFIISLDARGNWFRLHHLFRDILGQEQQRLVSDEEVREHRRRASRWFASQDMITDAIAQSLAAEDHALAAEIVEEHRNAAFDAGRWYLVDRWLRMLPAVVRQDRPWLLLAEAQVAYTSVAWDRIGQLLERIAAVLDGRQVPAEMAAEIAFFRGILLYWSGDAENGLRELDLALASFAGSDSCLESQIEVNRGLARCMLEPAATVIDDLEKRIQRAAEADGMFVSQLIGTISFIHLLDGDLPAARKHAQRLHRVAAGADDRTTAAWGRYLTALADLHGGDLAGAAHHFNGAIEDRHVLDAVAVVDALAALALTQQLAGQGEKSESALRKLEAVAGETGYAGFAAMTASARARVAVLRGDLPAAISWARTASADVGTGEIFLWFEVPAITRARVLLASETEGDLVQAAEALADLRQICERCRFTGQVIEVAVLQVLAHEGQGQPVEARRVLGEALALAEPGGWVRPFVEAGPIIDRMLRRLADGGGGGDFVDRLLVASAPGTATPASSSTHAEPVPHDLTDRELVVLELLFHRLRNKEIADQLDISAHTVNDHLKQIYQKLSVHRRRQAVDRAVELGILK